MDPVTHGLIGAAASQSFANKKGFRTAAFTGFVSALLADLDVFLMSPNDPLLNLELHRQFTHSLIFIPVGALIASALFWVFIKKYLTPKEIYLYSLAGFATAGIADWFTSYGVHMLWPFTRTRYSLDLISVFDPFFTAGILLLAGMAFHHRKKTYAWLAAAWIVVYLIFGIIQQQRATRVAEVLAEEHGHPIDQLVVKPTIANQWLWSIRYTSGDSLYAAGVKLVPFTGTTTYEGESAQLLNWKEEYQSFEGSTLYKDLARFSALSDGMLIRHPDHEGVIGDGRYSMLPTTLSPLWGIEVDTTKADQHVNFDTYRDAGEEVRRKFLKMLF